MRTGININLDYWVAFLISKSIKKIENSIYRYERIWVIPNKILSSTSNPEENITQGLSKIIFPIKKQFGIPESEW